jgi:hypothetical protein
MGFASGSEIFEQAVIPLLKTPIDQYKAIKALVEALADADWDTQDDVFCVDHPLVQKAYAEVWPQFYGPDVEDW